jgi:DNA-binding transcriptional MerR regulator
LDYKAPEAFRSISEVAEELDLPQHVLRFWESRFRDIKPMKRGGGRRYYRPDDINLLRGIRHLLYGEGYTIRGVQRILREQGAKFVQVVWQEGAPQPPHGVSEDTELADLVEGEVSAEIEVVDENGGFRERLTSLIGRDLGVRHDATAARREPPLESAPEPRIEPVDRAIHGAEAQPSGGPDSVPAVQSTPAGRLGREEVRKLHAVLHELAECRKLIEGTAGHPE